MSIGRKKLISILEGIVYENIYNNGNQIRYPISFDNNRELRGRAILKVSEDNESIFFSGHYKFGANDLYIYKALDEILKYLENASFLDTYELETDLEDEDEE